MAILSSTTKDIASKLGNLITSFKGNLVTVGIKKWHLHPKVGPKVT